jgi:hypothetical protein
MDGYIGAALTAAPDLLDWVVGVRGFVRRGHQLMSPAQKAIWAEPERTAKCEPSRQAAVAALTALGVKPGRASRAGAQAYAIQRRLPAHDAPHVDCACGIYAFYGDDEHLSIWPIVGVIRARGRLVVHQAGFRAAYVEVVALAFDPELGDGIEDQRLREVTRRACAWWRLPLLGRDRLLASLGEFGSPVPMELRPNPPIEEDHE